MNLSALPEHAGYGKLGKGRWGVGLGVGVGGVCEKKTFRLNLSTAGTYSSRLGDVT